MTPHVPARPAAGFTLLELAIVLIIVSLLAGGLMMTLSAQLEQRTRNETQQQLAEIREALIGFAASHNAADGKPHLPCPDTDGDGFENRNASNQCTNVEGILPWAELGTGRQDAWNNRFRYRVQQNFADKGTGFALNTSASLKVCDQSACTTTMASQLPAVILSHGPNGFGAINNNNVANALPTSADELQNGNGDASFVSHPPTAAGANEFDDLVVWLSPNVLFNRMLAAGRLP